MALAGRRSADPAAAGAESTAGGAEPQEVASRGNPTEEQPSAHPAARHPPTGACHKQLPADLHLPVCPVGPAHSQDAAFLALHHSSHLERQAEEGQEQPPAGPRHRRAGPGGSQRLSGRVTGLKTLPPPLPPSRSKCKLDNVC